METFRRALLTRHFGFVRRLLREGKISYKRAAKLFRITNKAITLRCFDFDNGIFDLATGPVPSLRERQSYQALAVREFAAKLPGETMTPFWKRLRLDYRYPLDFNTLVGITRSYAADRYKAPKSSGLRL